MPGVGMTLYLCRVACLLWNPVRKISSNVWQRAIAGCAFERILHIHPGQSHGYGWLAVLHACNPAFGHNAYDALPVAYPWILG